MCNRNCLTRLLEIDDKIDWYVDDNSFKRGKYSPGTAKIIKSIDEIPDGSLIICLAWRHLDKYYDKISKFDIVQALPSYNFRGKQ